MHFDYLLLISDERSIPDQIHFRKKRSIYVPPPKNTVADPVLCLFYNITGGCFDEKYAFILKYLINFC